MPKYDYAKLAEEYGIQNFGDKDLKPEYQGLVIIKLLEAIANETAETNRIERLKIKLNGEIIHAQNCKLNLDNSSCDCGLNELMEDQAW